VKRKWYPYGGWFINSIINKDDESYEFIKEKLWISGRFTYNIINIYNDMFDN